MNKYLIIFFSLLGSLLFSSKSCNSPEEENAAREETAFKITLDSINTIFESEYLSEQSLRAFEIKAKQKLIDFADYANIYTDISQDESFKSHTGQMIRDLFISDSVRIMIRISKDQKELNVAMNDFLKLLSASDFKAMKIIIDSVEISDPLHRTGDLGYAGSLRFIQKPEVSPATNNAAICPVSKKVEIIATRVRKPFGTDTLQIWQVFLGDIR